MAPMQPWAKLSRTVLTALLAVVVGASAWPPSAAAEQATQPTAAAAGTLDVGKFHSCALLPGGSLRCWGYGGDGALGYANTVDIGDDETPAAAGPVDLGAGRTAAAVSAGAVHTCALLDDGAVRCWGFGGEGRLGYANQQSIGDNEPPGAVGPVDIGPPNTAKAVTAGRAHSCAVLTNGDVRCWGFGFDGRLGYGNNVPNQPNNVGDNETPGSSPPVKLGTGRTATAITVGDSHTCAVLDDGSVRCWGRGTNGQLGYGNVDQIGDDESPDAVAPVKLGLGRKAVAIAAGDFHTCAVLDDGAVRCWGFGGRGRLGYANSTTIGDNETPDSVAPVDLGPGRTATAITAGADQTCAVLDDNSVRCWGFGGTGALGYGNTAVIGDDETPGTVGPVDLGAGRSAAAITAGGDHTCARLDDGSVRCWGKGPSGELGYCSRETIGDDETPGTAGPVDLGVPGARGVACAPPPAPPAPLLSSPPPLAPPSGLPPILVPNSPLKEALRAEAKRAAALRSCRAAVASRARRERASARRRFGRRSARTRFALRLVERRAAAGRQACLKRFGRTPGRVQTLSAKATAKGTLVLAFRAPGTDGSRLPAARSYLVRQARRPIRSARDFARAQALCKGTCRFAVSEIGTRITLRVTGLRPGRTYYYAIAARDNVSARVGPRSKTIRARAP